MNDLVQSNTFAADRERFPDNTGPTRLAILNSHPIQYFAPLYAHLATRRDVHVTALYMSDSSLRGAPDRGFSRSVTWNIDLLAGYESKFLGEAAKRRIPAGFLSLIVPEVWKELRSGRYDALLIHGHNYAANLIALFAAKSRGLPVLVRGETHLGLARGRAKKWLRQPIMRLFYRLTDHALAIGTANADYYRAMGVPSEKITLAPYSVDNARFKSASSLSPQEIRHWRKHFHIPPGNVVVLYAAKLTPRKRPHDLLLAAERLRDSIHVPFTLVFCGSGALEQSLREYCDAHDLKDVVFTGFVNQSDLPKLYGASDIFVLPSENEPWGLAVNEAMCAGLPIVLSEEIGCVPDLVTSGSNGFTFPAGDVQALSTALASLVENDQLRKRQGEESRARIESWGYEQCGDGIAQALRRSRFHTREG